MCLKTKTSNKIKSFVFIVHTSTIVATMTVKAKKGDPCTAITNQCGLVFFLSFLLFLFLNFLTEELNKKKKNYMEQSYFSPGVQGIFKSW